MNTSTSSLISAVLAVSLLSLVGCGDDDGGGGNSASPTPTTPSSPTATFTATQQPASPTPTATPQPTSTNTSPPTPTPTKSNELDISVCAPDAGPFSNEITNPFYLLPVGTQWVLEGEEDGAELRVEITSLDETEEVAGVVTRVIEEREWEDDELVEVSRNFFVQTADGTVCYYGEDVDDYEDGEIVGHDGAWRAGVDGALPGIMSPGDPQIGQSFQQEVAVGVAEDRAVQVAAGETVEVEFGTFTDTIRYEESSPLDSGTSEKIYARDVGLIIDDDIERVSGEE